MDGPTHRVTVEHYAETGETVSDGMGGTDPVREWQAHAESVPARYTPADTANVGLTEAIHGDVVQAAPVVRIHPRHIGEVVDGTYECAVRADGDWRVVIPGLAGEERYKVVTNVREQYAFGPLPTAVALDLELQDD